MPTSIEVMELDRYKAEMEKLKGHRKGLERAPQEIDLRERREEESLKALKDLEQSMPSGGPGTRGHDL